MGDEPFNRLERNTQDTSNLGVAQSLVMPEDYGRLLVGRKGFKGISDLSAALFFNEASLGAD